MGVTIEIEDWDPTKKYFGGDVVRGIVVVTNSSSGGKALQQDLVIKFSGKAESHWKEQRKHVGHHKQYLTTTFENETYFEEQIVLQDRDSSVDNTEIKPGRSEFPFQFELPLGLPESYKSDHGTVSYWAEVPYQKSWSANHSVKLEFLVRAHLDLNVCPREWQQPGQFTMEKSFWWGIGKVQAQLSLPSRCFVPLESINFTLEVINQSRCYLKKIRVYFCKVTTYRAKGSEFKEGARLSKIKCKAVYPRGTATIQGSIVVPDVPPTELGGCELIQPQYGIMIKVIATTFGKVIKSAVLEGRVPILVGTIPLGRSATAPALATATTLIRPISVLRRNSEFVSKRVTLAPDEDEEQDANQFTNLAE